MARREMKTSADYSGRTVDLLLLKTYYRPQGRRRLDVSASASPAAVTGIEKMVQRYFIAFAEGLGTVKFDGEFGTDLMADAHGGRIHNMATLTSSAAEADNRARNAVKAEDALHPTPDDEALASSRIAGLSFNRESASIDIAVALVSAAGETAEYTIPVHTGVGVRK